MDHYFPAIHVTCRIYIYVYIKYDKSMHMYELVSSLQSLFIDLKGYFYAASKLNAWIILIILCVWVCWSDNEIWISRQNIRLHLIEKWFPCFMFLNRLQFRLWIIYYLPREYDLIWRTMHTCQYIGYNECYIIIIIYFFILDCTSLGC